MTREDLKKHWKLIEAFKKGDEIQTYSITENKWCDVKSPLFIYYHNYRVKPQEEVEQVTEQESQFEIGKWYNVYGIYFKVKSVEYVESNIRVHGEKLAKNFFFENDWVYTLDFLTEMVDNGPMTDLQEIQDYLPDGHVDKQTKEIKFLEEDSFVIEFSVRVQCTANDKLYNKDLKNALKKIYKDNKL